MPQVSPDDDLTALGMDSVAYIEILMDAKLNIKDFVKIPQCRTPREILAVLQERLTNDSPREI